MSRPRGEASGECRDSQWEFWVLWDPSRPGACFGGCSRAIPQSSTACFSLGHFHWVFFPPSQIGFCSAATTSQNSQTPLSSDLGCKYRSSSSLDGLGAASPGHGKNIGIFLLSQPILAPWGHLQCPWTAGIPCLSSLPPWNPDSLLCHPFPALLTPGSPPMVSFHSFFFYSWPHPAPSKPLCCTLQDHPLVFHFFGIPWFIHCYP